MVTHHRKHDATTESGYNLRNADGTIKQAQISTHMTITLEGVGNKSERHGKHSSPGASDQQEGDELHVLVVEERHHGKAYRTQQQAGCIGHLDILELRQNSSPYNGTNGLNGKEHTHPVACFLEGFATVSAMAPVV